MSTQSKTVSLIEQIASTFIGLVVSLLTQLIAYPFYGMVLTFTENLELLAIFTVISIVRGYYVRRAFNYFHPTFERWMSGR